jgi:hypothetical protein
MVGWVAMDVVAQVLVDSLGVGVVRIHVVPRSRDSEFGAIGNVLTRDKMHMLQRHLQHVFEAMPGLTGNA